MIVAFIYFSRLQNSRLLDVHPTNSRIIVHLSEVTQLTNRSIQSSTFSSIIALEAIAIAAALVLLLSIVSS